MKHIASLSIAPLALAAVLAVGLGGAAKAMPFEAFEADMLETGPIAAAPGLDHPHHRCHGMASGTAHASCGTRTGGPSGGLF